RPMGRPRPAEAAGDGTFWFFWFALFPNTAIAG
ncbi:MAG: hypothetical protein ACI970_000747, partial [Myxococcota bacterium]